MAQPINFPEADAVEDFDPPHPSAPLLVKTFPASTVSCWALSLDEQQEVARTGLVWLTTRTFKKLDERVDGQRYQPDVTIQTNRNTALAGWGDPIAAPASDRIVTFQDNQPAADEARAALRALADQLRTGNDHGGMTAAEVEEAAREVMILEHAFACDALRVGWIMPLAGKSLRWIGEKATGAVVGRLALLALAAIAKVFGLHV